MARRLVVAHRSWAQAVRRKALGERYDSSPILFTGQVIG
jgi:hypothetical protein